MDERINYFTCTLGEAAILNASLTRLPDGEGEGVGRRRDGSSGWKTINEFVDFLADNEGDRVAVGIGVPSKGMTEENVDGRWGTEVMSE